MELPPFPMEKLDLPDDQLGLHLFAWWIGYQADRQGIPLGGVTQEIAEAIRVATLEIDTDEAGYVPLNNALRRVAKGDAAGAGKLFRNSLHEGAIRLAALDEAVSGRRRQRANAKKPRRDALQLLIEAIVAKNPKITVTELQDKLRLHEHGDVIETIGDTDGVIEWHDGNHPAESSPISGLKDRLSRAKKNQSR